MPEVFFRVRWPDGSVQRCASPSTVVEQALAPGGRYPVEEFQRRMAAALSEASERVRAKYGFYCTAAAQQAEELERVALRHHGGAVRVETMSRAPTRACFPAPDVLDGSYDVVVIGGGQAGLAASYCLKARGVDHVVLERHRVAHSWRSERWDEFCLVTPNYQCRLPGFPYAGDEPDGFMLRDEIVDYIEQYAASFSPPLHEGVDVTAVEPDGDGYRVVTNRGALHAGQVILAVGGYHVPVTPALSAALPEHITQLHSAQYRNPQALPDGAVLVVGSGQSGAQIAEDLHGAGRQVHLAVGNAPRVSRSYRGRDVVAWLEDMGHYDIGVDEHPEGVAVRAEANHYVTGRDGGHDIDLRAFAVEGMRLHGRLLGVQDGALTFAGDLIENLDAADETLARINAGIDAWIEAQGIDAPQQAPYEPVFVPAGDGSAPLALDAISTVVWATGFRCRWDWVKADVLDDAGYPAHERGATSAPGLYVLGLPWLHTWGSGRFAGIARDAEHIADAVAARVGAQAQRAA